MWNRFVAAERRYRRRLWTAICATWKRAQVKQGGRYRVGPGLIEVDAVELVPFAAITEADVRRAGEMDRDDPARPRRARWPIDEDILVYRIELHPVSPED